MNSLGGLWIALRDGFVFLALAALLTSLAGALVMAGLAVWPVLVALARDDCAWLALAVAVLVIALLCLFRMLPRASAQPVQALEQEAPTRLALPAYCERCGSPRPALICPMCGASALDTSA